MEERRNKVGYTATVVCGWAGAIFEGSGAFWQDSKAKKLKNAEKKCDEWTDQQTEGQTDGLTMRGVGSRARN